MEQKSNGVWRVVLILLAAVGVIAALAVVYVRMRKEIGALRYRLEQWMRLRPEPLTVDLTEE